MTEHFDVAIVGASHAAADAAITLRDRGLAGSIIAIGEGAARPGDRPSSSKAYVLGSITIERILRHDARYWAERNIELAFGLTVTRLDARACALRLGDGRTIGFGHCLLMRAEAGAPATHVAHAITIEDAFAALSRPGPSVIVIADRNRRRPLRRK